MKLPSPASLTPYLMGTYGFNTTHEMMALGFTHCHNSCHKGPHAIALLYFVLKQNWEGRRDRDRETKARLRGRKRNWLLLQLWRQAGEQRNQGCSLSSSWKAWEPGRANFLAWILKAWKDHCPSSIRREEFPLTLYFCSVHIRDRNLPYSVYRFQCSSRPS